MKTSGGLFLFVVGASLVGCGGVDQTKLAPVYRSAKAVEAATTAGVSYVQFTNLLQPLNTELAIARDQATNDQERTLVSNYAKAAALYQDSVALWAVKIDKGLYLSDYGAAKELADKYGLPRESTGTIDSDAGIQAIWAQAGVWLRAGNASYNGVKP